MPLSTESNFADIQQWLNKKLSQQQSIKACSDEVMTVPETKGIYFWFMKKDGYKALSRFIELSPMINTYSILIKNETYDLIYLGTAGTGKKGESNLRERLQWHIEQQHRESAINQEQSALSTLRTGIGALLSDDLILPNTEQSINSFFKKHMLVYWVSYTSKHKDIDSDENVLIKVLKPVLNLKNNPNARINAQINVTRHYKSRRKLVEENTKFRLQQRRSESENQTMNQTNVNKSAKTSKTSKPIHSTPISPKKIQSYLENCVEFTIRKNESIIDIIPNLPEANYVIEIFSSNRNDKRNYINGKLRKTGRAIHDYFKAPDTNNGNLPKWQMVYNEMNDKKKPIESITVRVCVESKNSFMKTSPTNPQTPINIDDSASTFNKSKKFKVVMICSKGKKKSFFREFPKIQFTNSPQSANEKFPDALMSDSNLTWRDYLNSRQNENTLLKAFELYTHPRYSELHLKFKRDFFILSAGWGLVNSEFKLPNYDITFSKDKNNKSKNIRNKKIAVAPIYKDYNHIDDNGDDILFLGSPNYIPLFISLTKDLKCRKIIFWKKKNTPQDYTLPNKTFKYEYYDTKLNTSWYYKLAQEL